MIPIILYVHTYSCIYIFTYMELYLDIYLHIHMHLNTHNSKAVTNSPVSQCHLPRALPDFSHPTSQGRMSSFPQARLLHMGARPACTAEPPWVTATWAGAGLGTPGEQQLGCRQWLLWAVEGLGTRLSGLPGPARSPGGKPWEYSHHYEQRENSVLLQDERLEAPAECLRKVRGPLAVVLSLLIH